MKESKKKSGQEKALTGGKQRIADFSAKIRYWRMRLTRLFTRDIWEVRHLSERNPTARLFFLLRILFLTLQGTKRNRIPLLGAALTFYSLIGLGPLVAIGIMVSSFMIDRGDENLAADALVNLITFAAPQTTLEIEADEGATVDGEEPVSLAPQVQEMVDQLVAAAQSGTVGVVGALFLFVIAIQVLGSIENSFNSIWGVSESRRLGEQIVVYWTFLTMGAIFGAASLTLFTLRTIASFFERLPFGGEFLAGLLVFAPLFTVILLIFAFAFFFRFIPNTKVHWKPALAGATLIVFSLYAYNWLSFLYVERVVSTQSLYGSLGIVIVLMLGFYVFWLLVLLGGQITYAVQNADYLTNENAWQQISERTREVVCLGVLLLAGERFLHGKQAIKQSELQNSLRIPSHIVNTSIVRLCHIGFLHAVHTEALEDQRDRAYLPSRPLDKISLADFKNSIESLGNNEGADLLADSNPIIRHYLDLIVRRREGATAQTIEDIVEEMREAEA